MNFIKFFSKIGLKSSNRQNISAPKYQIFTEKITVKFQNFSSVGGLRSPEPPDGCEIGA